MTLTITDLFCGGGGSSTGAIQVPGVEIKIAANHWQLAVDVHNENHPTADHAAVDLHEEDPRYFPRTDILWASPECFTAGHLVTTARGQVPIEAVAVGDLVLTHEGRWRPVVRTQSRQAPTVVVKGQGHTGIETTASHRFWLRDSKRVWKGRQDQYQREYGAPGWEAIGHAVERSALWATPCRVAPLGAAETPPLAFGLDLGAAWWLVGRWVGDGSLTFGRNHEVLLTCGFHEADEVRERLADSGGDWRESIKRTAIVFSLGDEKARDWLHQHFGHGAAAKQIPSWALTLPRHQRRALLDGYMSADGSFSGGARRASTVSKALAISLHLLAESLGHRVTVGTDRRTSYTIEGRTGVALEQWILIWQGQPSARRAPVAFEDGIHSWSRVRSVEPGATEATVYNIEVEEDHSYVLDGIVVANCTKWSQASGGKYSSVSTEANLLDLLDPDLVDEDPETAIVQRSRLLMFDVLRFAEHHRYKAMVIENVVDVARNPKFAEAWALWKKSLGNLGYDFRVVSLNSMHAQAHGDPAPQSRDRLYVVCWRKGNRVPDIDKVMRPLAWCPTCQAVVESQQVWKNGRTVGKYRTQYVYLHGSCGTTVEPGYLPAAAAIDWSMKGKRIGDRPKPLADKTRRRIAAGIAKYWAPFHMESGGNQYDAADPKHKSFGDPNAYYRAWSTHDVLRTLHTMESKALVVPLEGRAGDPRTTGQTLRTQTARHADALAMPPFMLERRFDYRVRGLEEPMSTLTANDTTKALVEPAPFIAELRGGGSHARSTEDPMSTVTASGNHHGLVVPAGGTWNDDARPTDDPHRTFTTRETSALVMPYYGATQSSQPTSKPIGTLTTVDRYALIQRHNSSKGDGAEMLTPASEAMRTLTTSGHQSLITPGDIEAAAAQVDDCLFRMLEPHEVAAGMAFPADYKWGGTRRERVKLCGNAVTPPAARDLIAAVAESLGGAA